MSVERKRKCRIAPCIERPAARSFRFRPESVRAYRIRPCYPTWLMTASSLRPEPGGRSSWAPPCGRQDWRERV